jgi:hypothetical protein
MSTFQYLFGNNTGKQPIPQKVGKGGDPDLSQSDNLAKQWYSERQANTNLTVEKQYQAKHIRDTQKTQKDIAKKRDQKIKDAQKAKQLRAKSYDKFKHSTAFKPTCVIFASLIGLFCYYLLPSAYKIFAFLIPALALSWGFSKGSFNFPVFLVFGLLFLLFPTSIFTLDTAQSINWDLVRVQNIAENVGTVVSGVFIIGVPIIGVIGATYAFFVGRIESTVAVIVKVILVVFMSVIFIAMAEAFNIPILGDLGLVTTIYNFVTDAVSAIYNGIGNVLNKVDFLNWFPDIPALPSLDLQLDVMKDHQSLRLMIIGSYPINLCLFAIVISIIALLLERPLPTFQFEKQNELTRPYAINYSFLVYLTFILLAYFTLYLWIGESNFLTYRNMGFFTIYLIIIVVSCLSLAFGIGSVSKMNINSILGIFYGLFALFITFNLFTQDRTFELLSFESHPENVTMYNVIVQLVAVAPAESFLFHIFIPSLCLYIIFIGIARYNNQSIDISIKSLRNKIGKLELENQYYQIQLLKPKLDTEQKQMLMSKDLGDTTDYLNRLTEIQKLTNQVYTLELSKTKSIQFNSSKLTTTQKISFYSICLISNILFSLMHFFNSQMDLRLFWSSGLGLIYVLSGCILTFISFRYGWFTGILVHALNNSWGLLMLLILGGN